jgi:hypothetical protein
MHRSSERILRNCNDSDPKMVRCNLGDEGFYPVDEATWRPMKDDEPDCILESEPLQIGVGQPLRGEEGGSTLPAEADW